MRKINLRADRKNKSEIQFELKVARKNFKSWYKKLKILFPKKSNVSQHER